MQSVVHIWKVMVELTSLPSMLLYMQFRFVMNYFHAFVHMQGGPQSNAPSFIHNCVTHWKIFTMLSLVHSLVNLQRSDHAWFLCYCEYYFSFCFEYQYFCVWQKIMKMAVGWILCKYEQWQSGLFLRQCIIYCSCISLCVKCSMCAVSLWHFMVSF